MGYEIKESLHYYTLLPMAYQLFRLVITVLLARILEPKDFGIIGLASIIVYYTNNLTNFGFSTALINKEDITDTETNSIFTVNLAISVLLSFLVICFARPIALFFHTPELAHALMAMTSIFLLTSFAIVALSLLKRDLQFKAVSVIELTTGGVQSILTLLLAWLGMGYWSMIIGLITSNILNAIMAIRASSWKPRCTMQLRALRSMFNYASWTFYEAQLRLLENYLDKVIIGKVLGPVSLGYYEKASGFAIMPVDSLVHKITGVMFSAFSRSQSNRDELLNYLQKTLVLISVLCFPVFAGVGLIADYFVPLLLGEKWLPMIPPLMFLLVAYALYSLVASVGSFNVAAGSYKKQISARMLCLILLLIFLVMGSQYGVTVVAAILMFYQLVFLVISGYLVAQKLEISVMRIAGWVVPALALTMLMTAVVWFVRIRLFSAISVVNMFGLMGTGVLVYVTLFFVFNFASTRFLRTEVIAFLDKFKSRYS